MDSYIIDIDGTVLDGTVELNHASTFLKYLEKAGAKYLLATNSIKSHTVQVGRLKSIGLSLPPEKIYTPVDSINRFIYEEGISNVMVVGSDDEVCQIKANHTFKDPDLIVLLDFEKNNRTYNDLQLIIEHLERGCSIVSASGSPFYLKKGKKQIDTGAFVRLIESVTDRKITILGKPSSPYFLNAKSILGEGIDSVTVIGDDWKTDIKGAREVGFHSILMKSGKYRDGDEERGKPDGAVDSFLPLLPSTVR